MENIKNIIDERLWNEIKKNYQLEQYSNSILDGVQFLGDLIREMSGEDGDGVNLMGRVFGPKSPKIKVNKLQTTTERDVQQGIMWLLQGLYSAIRNERAHTKKEDTEKDAFEIILFINYLVKVIDKSKGKYTVDNTLRRLFDDRFLPSQRYVDHLIKEIPPKYRFEVAIKTFNRKTESKKIADLAVFWNTLKSQLSKDQLKEIYIDASEKLRYTDKIEDITSTVFFLGDDWKSISEDARLRSENFLIQTLPTYLAVDPREDGPWDYEFKDIGNSLYELYIKKYLLLVEEFSLRLYLLFKDSRNNGGVDQFIIDHFGGILEEIDKYVPFEDFYSIIASKIDSNDRLAIEFVDKHLSKDLKERIKKEYPNRFIAKKNPTTFDDMDDDLPF